jgi:hypothetical protein
MKYLFTILLLLTANAYALDLCSYEETSDLQDAFESQGIKPVKTSSNHQKFTSVERHLIHKTVSLQDWRTNTDVSESLQDFGDYYNGKPGSNAGEILYYNIDGKRFILVHYWPGDNEYGAFFAINKNGSFKLLAEITDSFINCK